jgi:hypothetical protein
MSLRQVGVTLGAVGLAWAADLARACPSCASPLEENRQAFVDRRARQMEEAPEIQVPETLLRDAGRFQKGR